MGLHKYIFKVSGRAEYTTRHIATSAGEGVYERHKGQQKQKQKEFRCWRCWMDYKTTAIVTIKEIRDKNEGAKTFLEESNKTSRNEIILQ